MTERGTIRTNVELLSLWDSANAFKCRKKFKLVDGVLVVLYSRTYWGTYGICIGNRPSEYKYKTFHDLHEAEFTFNMM